eukprot:1392253-Rhodomonas_salina.2
MPEPDIANGAAKVRGNRGCPGQESRVQKDRGEAIRSISLRACCAAPGTDVPHGAISLHACYAISGTDICRMAVARHVGPEGLDLLSKVRVLER